MLSHSETLSSYRIAAVDRTLAVPAALRRQSGLRLSETSRETSRSEPTTLRYASNLIVHRLIEKAEDHPCRPGLRACSKLGNRSIGLRDVHTIVLPSPSAYVNPLTSL